MALALVTLPSADKITGVQSDGVIAEFQYRSAARAQFPKPEDVGPNTLYAIPMSIQQCRALHSYLSALLADRDATSGKP